MKRKLRIKSIALISAFALIMNAVSGMAVLASPGGDAADAATDGQVMTEQASDAEPGSTENTADEGIDPDGGGSVPSGTEGEPGDPGQEGQGPSADPSSADESSDADDPVNTDGDTEQAGDDAGNAEGTENAGDPSDTVKPEAITDDTENDKPSGSDSIPKTENLSPGNGTVSQAEDRRENGETVLTATDRISFRVEVKAPADAGIPEDAYLKVTELNEARSGEYLDKSREILKWDDEEVLFYSRIFDIDIMSGEHEVVPAAPVEVTMSFFDITGNDSEAANAVKMLRVVRFNNTHNVISGQEIPEIKASSEDARCDISFKTGDLPIFSIEGAAEKLMSWNAGGLDVTLCGIRGEQVPFYSKIAVNAPEEDVRIKDAYSVNGSDNMWIEFTGDPRADEDVLDNTLVYSTSDNETDELLAAGFADDEDIVIPLADIEGFAIAGIVLERTLTASDGREYRITVSYDDSAGLPDDTVLEVREITDTGRNYDDYLRQTLSALDIDAARYVKLFDISLVSGNNRLVHYQPEVPVGVKVQLLNTESDAEEYSVVHFAGRPEIVDASTAGKTVTFEADGFSAYAIVAGPAASQSGLWSIVTSMEDFAELASEGLYVGHVNGYYFKNTLRTENNRVGIEKTAQSDTPTADAALYYFEPVNGTTYDRIYAYCYNGTEKKYVHNGNNNSLTLTTESDKTAFTVTLDSSGRFRFSNGSWYWNMQGGIPGKRFCSSNGSATDPNNYMFLWHKETVEEDSYDLTGKSYGFMNYSGGLTGKAMMADALNSSSLKALSLTVLTKANDPDDKVFVPNDSDITMWKFRWAEEDDLYYITAETDGNIQYLKVDANGISMSDEPHKLKVIPGSGDHAGEICIKSGNTAVTYSGSINTGFSTGGTAGSEWLKLAAYTELSPDYFMTYSAKKVGVSDPSVTNGSQIIVYTRTWNNTTKKYEFYAIDHDGSLVPCFESGDSIQWVGNRINTLLWNFVEHYWEGTNDPNYYYELYNPYSEKYIAPQLTGEQILRDDPIGINLTGRQKGYYFSTILAWDKDHYSYTGLKTEDGAIVPCPKNEALDFYFAIMQDVPEDDSLTTVPTVDHKQYGITMRINNYDTEIKNPHGGNTSKEQTDVLGDTSGGAGVPPTQGLLTTNLINGYPNATVTGRSLSELFAGGQEVNNLFIKSTYSASGYYEFDSTQNFATLQANGNFRVYKELGTHDTGNKPTLKHGQFFPYNDISPGVFATINGRNLYDAVAHPLPKTDPRRNEQLYLIRKPDYYFGVEIEASFTQTPSGLDSWGHDIIYEFTGDDDFWLYVDGELIIDLGGIHSALPGSVNYSTGTVSVNGEQTTLRALFESNYRTRNPQATDAQVDEFLSEYFEEGSTVFKEYSSHTMKIFFMERGAGASNLHMRFNLASVKPGTVLLGKEISGVENEESMQGEYPYQIWYKSEEHPEGQLLTQDDGTIKVLYKDTVIPVPYRNSYTVDGITYPSVFMLRPGELAEVDLPDETLSYKIIECGINTNVYDKVSVNGTKIDGTPAGGSRADYGIDYDTSKNRPRVMYDNHVDPDALRILNIRKVLYDETGETELHEDGPGFNFRLYFASEADTDYTAANMYTYHIKDEDGNYCLWNPAQQKFISIGKTDYSTLTPAEKQSVSFTTSMNGSITEVPAFYTVEVREILEDTRFKVEERSNEIPDGYSLQKYVVDGNETVTPAEGQLGEDGDEQVDVCNLKGWGLRVNKIWSDADYMDNRNPAYFAVYTGTSEDTLVLKEGTVRRVAYKTDTAYWYFNTLTGGIPFDQYNVREVKVTGAVVDQDGVVTDYDSITKIAPGGTIKINGRQKGESTYSELTYDVTYEKGQRPADSNVRTDTTTNSRPGITLIKQDWDGDALAGAQFELKDNDGTLIGTFTSGDDGVITTAVLRENVPYTVTEIKTPSGHHGISNSMTMVMATDRTVAVSGIPEDEYILNEAAAGGMPSVIIKNRDLEFKAVKQGVIGEEVSGPLSGVHFELHREVKIGGVTTMDFDPIEGYEDLESDRNGIIPLIDETLGAGTYYLKEKAPSSGYQTLEAPVRFTLSETGYVTTSAETGSAEVTSDIKPDGTIVYTLAVKNKQFYPSATGFRTQTRPYGLMFLIGMLIIAAALVPVYLGKRKAEDQE